jgi:hypothetical protein
LLENDMTTKHTLAWVNPVARVDGTVYDQALNAGYEIQLDATPAVSIPLAYGTTFDLSTLAAWPTLTVGIHTAGIAVVDTGGLVSGFGTATFSVFSTSPPLAPSAATIS